jgi:hypothetical protein
MWRHLSRVRARVLRLLRADAGANTQALEPALRAAGMSDAELERVYRTFNVGAPEFGVRERIGAGSDDDPQE